MEHFDLTIIVTHNLNNTLISPIWKMYWEFDQTSPLLFFLINFYLWQVSFNTKYISAYVWCFKLLVLYWQIEKQHYHFPLWCIIPITKGKNKTNILGKSIWTALRIIVFYAPMTGHCHKYSNGNWHVIWYCRPIIYKTISTKIYFLERNNTH